MELTEILGLIICFVTLSALIVLLFIICIPTSKEQNKHIKIKTKMYIAITKYFENLNSDD